MKLNLTAPLGVPTATFSRSKPNGCPQPMTEVLKIEGVESVFVCGDFVTINRDPRASWEPILAAATKALTGQAHEPIGAAKGGGTTPALGQVRVSVQTFRQVPIQVKATDGQAEKRIALDPRFGKVAREIQARVGGDYLKERYWADRGFGYGSVEEVAASVVDEIEALMDDSALARILAETTGGQVPAAPPRTIEGLEAELKSEDWRQRFRAVKQVGTNAQALPVLTVALKDAKPEIRRWAAAALGATGSALAVPPLCEALRDSSVAVRRTVGDSLSDLGDPSAQPAMLAALTDANKLVRWRAARFLAEVGTVDALPSLGAALQDPEFEVRREVEAAIERIRGGAPGATPVWKRMSG